MNSGIKKTCCHILGGKSSCDAPGGCKERGNVCPMGGMKEVWEKGKLPMMTDDKNILASMEIIKKHLT